MSEEDGKCLIDQYIAAIEYCNYGLDPYPTSIRCTNWIKFISSHKIQDQVIDKALLSQYRYLMKNIEYHISGNHLLENACSLLFGAYYFHDKKLYKKADTILKNELDEQILPDGAHYELSPMYHRIVLNRLMDCINLMNNNSYSGSDDLYHLIKTKTIKMIGWIKVLTYTNGKTPHFNDSAEDIAPSLYEIHDYADRLKITRNKTIALKESGYRKFNSCRYECIVDYGLPSPAHQPGHSHCDIFSFELYINNLPVIVDTGTSTYEKFDRRYTERSTRSHNTVQIGSYEQAEIWSYFRIGRRPKIYNFEETSDFISGSHDGFKNGKHQHKRSFRFRSNDIKISDEIIPKSSIPAYAFLHFHPDQIVKLKGSCISAGDDVQITIDGCTNVRLEEYQYSHGFNKLQSAVCAVITFYSEIVTTLVIK